VQGPIDTLTTHTRGGAFGFATGLDARIGKRLSAIGDLTIDLGSPDALSSTRFMIGSGWRF
jgi:hypothetical protein